MLNLRLVEPALLIDVRHCDELHGLSEQDDAIVFGAGITHAEIEDGAVPDPTPGWLRGAAQKIAYRAVRNRGTIGGSVAHADPAADWLTVFMALDADVLIWRDDDLVSEPLTEFVTGPFATTLQARDLVVGIRVVRPSPAAKWGYAKVAIKSGEFAQALCVGFVDPARECSRIVMGALGGRPLVRDEPLDGLGDLHQAEQFTAHHAQLALGPGRRRHAVALQRCAQELLGQGS